MRIDDEDFALNFHVKSYCDIISIYDNFLRDCPDVIEIALLFPLKAVEKYDYYLTDELLDKAYSHNYLDIPSALNIIKGLHP